MTPLFGADRGLTFGRVRGIRCPPAGEMAEWPKAPDSKSGLPKGNVGSTPTLSSHLNNGNPDRVPKPSRDGSRRAKLAAPHALMGTEELDENLIISA